MKEKDVMDTDSMMREINSMKPTPFQKGKKIDVTLQSIRASNSTNNKEIKISSKKVANNVSKDMKSAFK